jgi:hypothetical protein
VTTLAIYPNASLRGLSLALALAAGLALATPCRTLAAQSASAIQISAAALNSPYVLDQSGTRIAMPTKQHPSVTLAAGTVPTYVAYGPVSDPGTLPASLPAVYTNPANFGKTSPHHFDAALQAKLNQDLASDGRTAMHTQYGTYLVKPLASVFADGGTGGSSTGHAWLASVAAATSTSTSTTPATGAETLVPPTKSASTTTTAPTSYGPNYILRDLANMFHISAGKLANLNKAALDRLAKDVGLNVPTNVTTHPSVQHPATTTAAQMLDPTPGATATVQPAPIPEPSTLAFFGLVLGAWGVRRGLSLKRGQ